MQRTNFKKYLRDGRAPIPQNPSTSVVMSANKAKNTKPELLLRKALWHNKMKGYRLHAKKVPGRPDITFPIKKIAIFVNGCFWHRCPYCDLPKPKTNVKFWEEKFKKNIKRDKIKIVELKKMHWKTITIWECQINTNVQKCITQILKLMD